MVIVIRILQLLLLVLLLTGSTSFRIILARTTNTVTTFKLYSLEVSESNTTSSTTTSTISEILLRNLNLKEEQASTQRLRACELEAQSRGLAPGHTSRPASLEGGQGGCQSSPVRVRA